ncbi:MAG: hypothetical protein LQ341_001039 [Variospora aurantia]|nr:MAG: hypothetical protein LQ341_001039 [Variospora aurantia]
MTENWLPTRQNEPIALVPVGLKEAAIDSPTFRAGVLHFADQVDVIERWLESWLKSALKVAQEAGALESIINGFLSQITPPANVSEAVLDHDYTLLALDSYGEGARELWTSTILGMRKMEARMVEPIRSLVHNELRSFKDSRRVLEQTQKAYDGLLYRLSAQSRKEPSSLREDAFQIHEARKMYLKASMDFSVMAVQLRSTLDKVLVNLVSDQWREMRNARGNSSNASGKWNIDIERVRSWSRELENGEAAFRRELQSARRQIEDSTEAASRPPRELEAYATPVPSMSGPKTPVTTQLMSQAPPRAEKQGWLFLKTISGKPTKTIWIRRWVFVKNGIFGWLVQGSRSGGVEESDRIGVLLCNIRPITSEERLFLFEVKTKDLSIILQADSQGDMVEWMKAFEIAKQKALEDRTSTDSPGLEGPSQDPAFAISSPPAPEFAASAADSGMQQFREDSAAAGLERGSTLPVPGADNGFGLPSRSSTDVSSHRRSVATERDGESGKDHAARIIQKLDLHRKSTGGPPGGPPPSSRALAGGGIASLIAASHTVMPVGPGVLPQSPRADAPSLRIGGFRNRSDIPSTSMAPSTLVNAPAPTNLSATAVLVSGERGIGLGRTDATGGMPSGVMANVWGSSNWGYLNRLQRGEVKAPTIDRADFPTGPSEAAKEASSSRTSLPAHRKTASLPGGIGNMPRPSIKALEYPSYYPVPLKTQDAQFRLLFPNVDRTERVVVVFRATWSLNEQQEFPGRVYATEKHIYFYSHHFGLVLTSGIALDSVAEVTAAPGRDYDLLFIHLKETSENTSSARITIKAFLEPLRLLQQRLNFLVDSGNSEQPPDTETMIQTLIKFDQTNSPTKDKWEDYTATATSDEGKVGENAFSSSRDLRAAVMFDGRMYGSAQDEPWDTGKIKLPRQPVLYVPTGMDRPVVDKIFDVSSKALFHVLFGDRSAIWQLLYHERRAQRIKQGSWIQHEQRRLRSATIIDYQMVDVLNDHLCYVVTDRKTAWHLPQNKHFSLLSKIVVTHHAKSKCRLAIYSKVDWTYKTGILQGIISNQALKDLELNALDLFDLITDQVRKLGAQSRTRKAIRIFGQVGVQTQAFEFAGSDAPITTQGWRSMRRRTTGRLLAEFAVASTQRFLTSIMNGLFSLCRWFFKTTNANMVLLAVLGASVLTNVLFSSNGTVQWWRDRQAGNYLARLGIGSGHTMGRAVYLRDTDDAWGPRSWTVDGSQNTWYEFHPSGSRETFESYISDPDVGAPKVSASASGPSAGQASVDRLRRSRQRLGTRRHDLMVALRVINRIELEMVEAEWEGWLYSETAQCEQIEQVLGRDGTQISNMHKNGSGAGTQRQRGILGTKHLDWAQVRLWHEKYCRDCYSERESLINE